MALGKTVQDIKKMIIFYIEGISDSEFGKLKLIVLDGIERKE